MAAVVTKEWPFADEKCRLDISLASEQSSALLSPDVQRPETDNLLLNTRYAAEQGDRY